MRPCILAATALLGPALVACSDGVSVRAELMRLPEPTVVAAGEAALSIPPWTSNVTLTSVRAPITEISITRASGAGPGIVVYDCPGSTASACMVELNGPALESLLPTSPVAVEPGTYEEIVVSHCLPGATGWTAQITGTAVLGGTTYYTRTAGNRLGTTGPAQPVTVSFDGCGLLSPILPPLVISDVADATILLRLYFDMRDLAWAALTDPSTQHLLLLPGCSGINPTGFICTAYTSVFAVPGTDVPVVERYRLNASATFGLVFEPGADRSWAGISGATTSKMRRPSRAASPRTATSTSSPQTGSARIAWPRVTPRTWNSWRSSVPRTAALSRPRWGARPPSSSPIRPSDFPNLSRALECRRLSWPSP
jgi:hypothetical protein